MIFFIILLIRYLRFQKEIFKVIDKRNIFQYVHELNIKILFYKTKILPISILTTINYQLSTVHLFKSANTESCKDLMWVTSG